MGILLCEQHFRDVWIRNKSVRAEIGQLLRTHTQTHTHTTAAKLVVRITFQTNVSVAKRGSSGRGPVGRYLVAHRDLMPNNFILPG